MLEAFSMPFMQRALIAGVLVGFLASYYGVFIVQRKMSFLGSGLAHAAFGGVALGLLLNAQPLAIAVPFTIFVSLLIIWLREKTKLGSDAVIGVLFAVSVALGIIFLSLKDSFATDAFTYLFGSILAVFPEDIYASGAIALLTISTAKYFWPRWAYSTFDEEIALAGKHKIMRNDYALAIFIAVTIVVSIKIVGIILIAAFLVIPAAGARMVSTTFFAMTALSCAIGIFSAGAGLWASYYLDLPSGAVIILLQAAIFFAAIILGRLLRIKAG